MQALQSTSDMLSSFCILEIDLRSQAVFYPPKSYWIQVSGDMEFLAKLEK